MSEPDANGWMPIESAPARDEFLAYGSYLYEGDDEITSYMMLAHRTGSQSYPFATEEGLHAPTFFTHWHPLPKPPVSEPAQ